MDKERILFTVAYDGTNYCGWQVQENGATVQGVLMDTCSRFFNVPPYVPGESNTTAHVLGASRTDAGVHALGQRAVLTLPEGTCKVPPDRLPEVLNAKLPPDIVLTHAEYVPRDFHPIFDAKRKTYAYSIHNAVYINPLLRNQRYHVKHPLNVAAMHDAAKRFIGEHDFEAFRAMGGTTKTSVRRMFGASVTQDGETVTFTITGNGFLYNMVRIMAGTLVAVGEGKMTGNDIATIIAARNRVAAGKTLPPQGLTLLKVYYEADLEKETCV